MRAYFFGNMYLSSIQQGIQAQHATTRMFIKYEPNLGQTEKDRVARDYLIEWGTSHETSILLNAGYSSELRSIIQMLKSDDNPFPWSEFYESQEALDGALTCVGIILPAAIYEAAKMYKDGTAGLVVVEVPGDSVVIDPVKDLTPWMRELAQRLNNYGLAK